MPLSMLIGLLIAQDPAPPPQDATAIGDVVVVGRADKVEAQIKQVFPKAKIVKYDAELKKL